MHVRLEGRTASLRPIAGTRPRGQTPAADAALEHELLADPKECAEHVMLVDLGRNDLGRVSAPGSVSVDELMEVEYYSHVMHIVSNVTGTLAEGRDAIDALEATFPAGTVSGAPKVRAMEIIAVKLEPAARGPYAGTVGYFGLDGAMDMCITIRTVVLAGGRTYLQSGAGIVADSDPEREYEECRHKAAALHHALELAAGMVATLLGGVASFLLGIVFKGENVAYMVGLAFAIAASANFPALVLSIFLRPFSTRGAQASMIVGTLSALLLIFFSPTIQVSVLGRDSAPFPLRNPGLVTIPLSFFVGMAVSLLAPEREASSGFAEFQHRVHLGPEADEA